MLLAVVTRIELLRRLEMLVPAITGDTLQPCRQRVQFFPVIGWNDRAISMALFKCSIEARPTT